MDKIIVEFGNGLPYRRPRLEEVLYGINKVFTNKDLISTNQKHDVDPLSRRLPSETMQFVLLDYEHNYDPDKPSAAGGSVRYNDLIAAVQRPPV